MAREKGEKESAKRDVRKAATARGTMEKSWRVRIIEWKEVRGDDPIEYFLPTGIRSTF